MKLYELIVETANKDLIRKTTIAKSTGDAKKREENEIIRIKEISDKYPISVSYVKNALQTATVGDTEINIILQSLKECYSNLID